MHRRPAADRLCREESGWEIESDRPSTALVEIEMHDEDHGLRPIGFLCSDTDGWFQMGMLTSDMQRIVRQQRLGFVATVCRDGTPNLSPKGTTAVWDEDNLMFVDVRSPQTVQNIEQNPSVEINVVDPLVRKGCRFKGRGTVYRSGEAFDRGCRVPRSWRPAFPFTLLS